MPKISVIVPVYNAMPGLNACIESILAQTMADFELLLVDDCSTDDSGAQCDRWAGQDSRIRVFHQANTGAAGARNAGLDAATGEYIAFADSDDLLSPYYLELLLGLCEQTGCAISMAGFAAVPTTGPLPVWSDTAAAAEVIDAAAYCERLYTPQEVWYVVPWAKLYHRTVFEAIRYPLLRRSEDEAVIHLLAEKAGRIAVCDTPVYAYLQSEDSMMRTKGFRPAMLDSCTAYEMRAEHFRAKGMSLLTYLTLRTLLATLLFTYSAVTDDTADAAGWRRQIRKRYDRALWQMLRTPGASRRFCLEMLRCRMAMRPGAQFDRNTILFRQDNTPATL